MTNGLGSIARDVLERHGFGAFVALLLLGVLFGYIPSPLTALAAHVARDPQREAIFLAICLNTAPDASGKRLCWDALITGVGPRP